MSVKKRLLDTNVIVRHLVQDNDIQAKLASKLFDACDRGEIILVVLSAVLAETVFVLESFYNHRRNDIADVLLHLIASPGVELKDESIHQAALIEYGKNKLHFVDCLVVAYARDRNWSVATYDQGLRKSLGIKGELVE